MSYDVYLEIDTGGEESVGVFSRNHTSNTSNMWRKAGCDIAEFDGKPATVFEEALRPAIAEILANRHEYTEFEPSNGWGDIDSTVAFMTDLADACAIHAKTIVRVSR